MNEQMTMRYWLETQIAKAEGLKKTWQRRYKASETDEATKQKALLRITALGGKLCSYKQALHWLNVHHSN